MVVLEKIKKYDHLGDHHYWLICESIEKKEIRVIERVSYQHTTESFGFLYNNAMLDRLRPVSDVDGSLASAQIASNEACERYKEQHYNWSYADEYVSEEAFDNAMEDASTIYKGEVIRKSLSFDDSNNYRKGVNMLTAYVDCNQLTEDPVIISSEAVKKFSTVEIKPIDIQVNENDILINMHGDDTNYKPLPDVGEHITGNMLYCLRRENKEDALFTQSIKNLSKPMLSDDSSPVEGMVVDIDVYCNNPQGLETYYNKQLKWYAENTRSYCTRFVEAVDRIMATHPGYKMSHELSLQYFDFKRVIDGVQFIISEKPFNNILVRVTVLEHCTLKTGDKVANRYGGKGVACKIVPVDEMPKLNGRPIDIMWRSSTGINRENAGQYKEVLTTGLGIQVLDHIRTQYNETGNYRDFMNEYLKFLQLCNPAQAQKTSDRFYEHFTEEERVQFVEEVCALDSIRVILDPVHQNLAYDDFIKIMEAFPYVHPLHLTVPMKDCKGNTRWVRTDRTIGVGYEYILMLKQKAIEKYSEASFSSVNIRGDNSKDGNKLYRHRYKRTPIRVGHMENGSLDHLGPRAVITQLMLYGTSPTGRMNAGSILTGDPFEVNIRLTDRDMNRKAEIIAADLKGGMGLELVITRKKKLMHRLKKQLLPFSLASSAEDPKRARARYEAAARRRFEKEEEEEKAKLICPFKNARAEREAREKPESKS